MWHADNKYIAYCQEKKNEIEIVIEIVISMVVRSADTNLCLVFFFLTVRFSYFISVVLKCIRSYPYVYFAI